MLLADIQENLVLFRIPKNWSFYFTYLMLRSLFLLETSKTNYQKLFPLADIIRDLPSLQSKISSPQTSTGSKFHQVVGMNRL